MLSTLLIAVKFGDNVSESVSGLAVTTIVVAYCESPLLSQLCKHDMLLL